MCPTYLRPGNEKGGNAIQSTSSLKSKSGRASGETVTHFGNTCNPKILVFLTLPAHQLAGMDHEEFRKLLVGVWERFDPIRNKSEQILTTNFRKAVRIYDWLRYGHKKTPEAPKDEEAE